MNFGKFANGTYQTALSVGHNLGVFASSDHISQHASYGGVYCKEFTREGKPWTTAYHRRHRQDLPELHLQRRTTRLPENFPSFDQSRRYRQVSSLSIVRNEKDGNTSTSSMAKPLRNHLRRENAEDENRYYAWVIQLTATWGPCMGNEKIRFAVHRCRLVNFSVSLALLWLGRRDQTGRS